MSCVTNARRINVLETWLWCLIRAISVNSSQQSSDQSLAEVQELYTYTDNLGAESQLIAVPWPRGMPPRSAFCRGSRRACPWRPWIRRGRGSWRGSPCRRRGWGDPPCAIILNVKTLPELIVSPKLSNVWVFVQLIFGPFWPMNQLNKNPNIALLETSYQLWTLPPKVY